MQENNEPIRELQARIALVEHHTSQMQGYKTYILTVAILILTTFEIWFRVETCHRGFPVNVIMSVALGAILASAIAFVARSMWYGQLVRSAVRGPAVTPVSADLLMSQLDQDITHHAQRQVEIRTGRIDWIVKWFAARGDHRKTAELWAVWLVSCLLISVVVFFVSPMFGLGPITLTPVFIILGVLVIILVIALACLALDC